jgi:hypothetical protein
MAFFLNFLVNLSRIFSKFLVLSLLLK